MINNKGRWMWVAVFMVAVVLCVVGCKKKHSVDINTPQPATESAAPTANADGIIYGTDGTIYPDNTPDLWTLPVGETFVTVILAGDGNFVVTRAGNVVKLYRMYTDGHLGQGYQFQER